MLPARTQDVLNALRESPERYYDALTPAKADEPLTDATPTLARIQQGLGAPGARLAVSVALLELSEWFNVQKNLTDRQIAMVADMIVKVHWDLSLNDIKAVFEEKKQTAKLFGKLDGSDIMGWIADYKAECIAARQRRLDEEWRETSPSGNAITFEEWCARTPKELNYLANGRAVARPRPTEDEMREKEADFQRFRREYLKSKGIEPK